MILVIDDHKTIDDLQDKFNECFPYLKIEFYDGHLSWNASSAKKHSIPSNNKIGNIRENHNPGLLVIKSWYKTGKVEQDFSLLYGLHVKVLCLQNQQWVHLAHAEEQTLAEQSETAKCLSEKRKKNTEPVKEDIL